MDCSRGPDYEMHYIHHILIPPNGLPCILFPNKVCWNKQLFICSPVTVNFQIKKWNFRLISNFARDFNRYQDGFTLRAWTLKIPISNKLVRVLHDEKDGHICTQVFFWLVPSGESLQKSSWNLRNEWDTLSMAFQWVWDMYDNFSIV